jgi:hypothetical protein
LSLLDLATIQEYARRWGFHAASQSLRHKQDVANCFNALVSQPSASAAELGAIWSHIQASNNV